MVLLSLIHVRVAHFPAVRPPPSWGGGWGWGYEHIALILLHRTKIIGRVTYTFDSQRLKKILFFIGLHGNKRAYNPAYLARCLFPLFGNIF
jgi:hypothetical protein